MKAYRSNPYIIYPGAPVVTVRIPTFLAEKGREREQERFVCQAAIKSQFEAGYGDINVNFKVEYYERGIYD